MKKIYLILLGLFLSWGYAISNPTNLYLVGTATEGEWDTAKGTIMTKDGNYFYWIGYLKAGVFKFNTITTGWSGQFGYYGNDNDPATDDIRTFTSEYGSKNASSHRKNILINTAGNYHIYVKYNSDSDIKIYGQLLKETTYTVTVPEGTQTCSLAGDINGWSFKPMASSGANTFTMTVPSESKVRYKYSCSTSWDNNETNSDGSSKPNRTYSENDVVAKWKTDYAPSINLSDLFLYGENTLAAVKNMTLVGDWDNTALGNLQTALGSNQGIETINFTGAISTNWTDNYFTGINPACVLSTESELILDPTSEINIPKAINATGGYTYSYTPSKYADGKNGWETICLPFNVSTITASKEGEADKDIQFFTSSASAGDFWLKTYKESTAVGYVGFDYAPNFNANTPYIIAIPGSKWGAESDLTDWTIKFKGMDEIKTGEANTSNNNYIFKGSYNNSNLDEASYVINTDGNSFIQGPSTIAPFQAYMSAVSGPSNVRMLSFGNGGATGMEQTFTGKSAKELNIMSAKGSLIIHTDKNQTIQIFGIDGRLVRTANLQEGDNTINGLTGGVYLIENQKAIVK